MSRFINFFRELVDNRVSKPKTGLSIETLESHGFQCGSCGEFHKGLMNLGSDRPVGWPDSFEKYKLYKDSGFLLTDDSCVMNGTDFFVKGLLQIPLREFPGKSFGYLVWCSLSKSNFEVFEDTFGQVERAHLGPWFGWLSSHLAGYPSTPGIKCNVRPQDDKMRPLIELEPTDHPLAIEQRYGITLERLFDIYAINGHPVGTPDDTIVGRQMET